MASDDQVPFVTATSIPHLHSQNANSQDVELLEVPPSAHKLFNQHTIPVEDLLPHILQVRDRAFRSHPSQALGHYDFLTPAIARSPAYEEVLLRLKKGNTNFIDIGCGLGQDLRQLAADGAPVQNLYGVDSASDLIEYGYDLFGDRDALNAMFMTANLFRDTEELQQIRGHMDIVWCGRLLDTLSWEKQVDAVVRMLRILRKGPNAVVFGRVVGRTEVGEYEGENGEQRVWHDVKSFKKMFHEGCDVVEEAWETDVVSQPWMERLKLNNSGDGGAGMTEVTFVARRLERVDGATSHRFVF